MWANVKSDSSFLRDNRCLQKVGLQVMNRPETKEHMKRQDLLSLQSKLSKSKEFSGWRLLPDN